LAPPPFGFLDTTIAGNAGEAKRQHAHRLSHYLQTVFDNGQVAIAARG